MAKSFFESGALKAETNYVNGERHGVSKVYNEKGVLIIRENYVNGKLAGSWHRDK